MEKKPKKKPEKKREICKKMGYKQCDYGIVVGNVRGGGSWTGGTDGH